VTLFLIALAILALNIPFGWWRAGTRKFSLPWFVAVHGAIPLVVALRLAAGVGLELATFPLLVGAYAAGQILGGALRGWLTLERAGPAGRRGQASDVLFLSLLPAILGALLLAAHFLRAGHLVPVVACLALPLLLLIRRAWVPAVIHLALLAGAVEWVRTLMILAAERRALGEPATRLALILGGVATFTVLAGLLMKLPVVRRHYATPVARETGAAGDAE
jgi:hypothetical protein